MLESYYPPSFIGLSDQARYKLTICQWCGEHRVADNSNEPEVCAASGAAVSGAEEASQPGTPVKEVLCFSEDSPRRSARCSSASPAWIVSQQAQSGREAYPGCSLKQPCCQIPQIS